MRISDWSSDVCSSDLCHLGHAGSGNRCDQLCAMFGNTLRLIFAANHETGNVLQKQQWYAAWAGQFYEMRSVQGAFTELHTLISQTSYGESLNMDQTESKRTAKQGFEFVKRTKKR